MKKILSVALLLCLIFSFTGCTKSITQEKKTEKTTPKTNYEFVKATWIAYYEIGDMLNGMNENEATEKLDNVFSSISALGINTVYFHVRAFEDAFYKSTFFPRTSYVSKDYDVLKIAVEKAHKYKLSFHAWINPYRVGLKIGIDKVSDENPAKKLYSENKSNVIICSGGVFLNPASINAQKLIINGVREIINNYNVDGIQFDDYFYPSTEKSIDKLSYAEYCKAGGKLTLEDYRRENVNALLQGVYEAVKGKNENIEFGISPQCSAQKNYDNLYADVNSWINGEYLDYICPQVYFGFNNQLSPFKKSTDEWVNRMKNKKCKLLCGLALYKSGKEDEYASDNPNQINSPYYEWCDSDDIIARQIDYIKGCNIGGYAIYSYSSIFNDGSNKMLNQEVENMKPKLLS